MVQTRDEEVRNVHELAYAPKPSLARRRGIRLALAVTFVLALAGSWLVLRSAFAQWQHRQAQRKVLAVWESCLKSSLPAGCVVYEEDPERSRVLLQSPAEYAALAYDGRSPPIGRRAPAAQATIAAACRSTIGNWAPIGPTLFFGERSNPRLNERMLLIVNLHYTRAGVRDSQNIWSFDVTELLPAWTGDMGIRQWTVELLVPEELNAPDQRVRFFAGRPDPADPSRFSIDYAVNDQSGTIDGWLSPLSLVVLKVRNGPATRPAQ